MTRGQPGDLVDQHGRKYLTADERQQFLAAVRAHPKPTVQTLAMTLTLTGCRISEALGLRANDVDLTAAELRIRTLKRRREAWRAVPVPTELSELDLVHCVRHAQASPRRRTALLGSSQGLCVGLLQGPNWPSGTPRRLIRGR